MISRKVLINRIKSRSYRCLISDLAKRSLKSITRNRQRLCLTFVATIILMVTNYIIDSLPIPIGGEVTVAQWLERIDRISGGDIDNVPDSICLINVTYDKALVNFDARLYSESENSPKLYAGKITTTDRAKLLRFLTITDSLKNYKYILLDIRFEADIESDATTDSLFALIRRTDNVVFAAHNSSQTNPEAPIEKSAYGDYYTTFLVSDVVKYPIFQQDPESIRFSIPTKIYSDLYNHEFSMFGPFAFDNGKLCKSSIYPTYQIKLTNWAVKTDQSQFPTLQYLNLGEDLLNNPNPRDIISTSIENKIVVIGDFNEDLHDTYIGLQPGAIVNLNTYVALCKGQHLVNWVEITSSFFVFFIISWLTIEQKSILHYVPYLRKSRSHIIKFFITFLGFSVILMLYAIIVYFVFNTIFSIVYPSLFFTILELCSKSIK